MLRKQTYAKALNNQAVAGGDNPYLCKVCVGQKRAITARGTLESEAWFMQVKLHEINSSAFFLFVKGIDHSLWNLVFQYFPATLNMLVFKK